MKGEMRMHLARYKGKRVRCVGVFGAVGQGRKGLSVLVTDICIDSTFTQHCRVGMLTQQANDIRALRGQQVVFDAQVVQYRRANGSKAYGLTLVGL